jgi:hypothetical protein
VSFPGRPQLTTLPAVRPHRFPCCHRDIFHHRRVLVAGDIEPKDLHAATLTEAVGQAAAVVVELYAGYPPNPVAELQLAIYPWKYHMGHPMYDISIGRDGFTAHGLQDQVPPIEGATLEELVTAAEHARGAGIDHCMFRWIRPVASLLRDASTPEPDDSQP